MTAEAEKTSSCVCGLHDVARPGEPDKKNWQRSGTPWGRRHATTSANLLIPVHGKGIKCARGGGRVHHHCEGGGGNKRLTFPGVKAASDVELWSFVFFGGLVIEKKKLLWTP